MEPPTTCVADNNSANLAFMAIATKRAHLELQDENFILKFFQMYLLFMETIEVAMARSSQKNTDRYPRFRITARILISG